MPAQPKLLRLGVDIDHVATAWDAFGGRRPDTVRAARRVVDAIFASGAKAIRQMRAAIGRGRARTVS